MLPLIQSTSEEERYRIINDDCLSVLGSFDDDTFDLVVTSPPYNIGKSYETRTSIESYLSTQENIIAELVRTLSARGNLCWQVGNFVDRGEVYPLDIYYYPIFKRHGLKLRNRIVWHFGHGLHASNRFSGRYETLLWFSKTDDYVFNLDDVRVESKYPGKLHFKGPKRGQPSGNPLGKNPSDIWEVLRRDWDSGLWNIPNVKANHPEKTEHPCQFPLELVERCVLALSNEGGKVLDPFAGVFSTVIAALLHDRIGIGIERDADYVRIGEDRIKNYFNGSLRKRPMTKSIHVPSSNDKIAKIPDTWKESRLRLFSDRQEQAA